MFSCEYCKIFKNDFFIAYRWGLLLYFFFFSIRIFFHGHWRHTGQQGKEGDHFYSPLPYPSAHEHSDIYLQLCMWDDYHIFLIATLVFTRLLLNEILQPYRITIWLIDDVKFVLACLLDDLILGYCYNNLDTGKPVESNSHRQSPLYYKRTD